MFHTQNRNNGIKGRGCADGQPQCAYKTKLETSSPTTYTPSIIITNIIGAKEERDDTYIDIPGAFLQIDASDNNYQTSRSDRQCHITHQP